MIYPVGLGSSMNILKGSRLNGAMYTLSPALNVLPDTPLDGFTEKYYCINSV